MTEGSASRAIGILERLRFRADTLARLAPDSRDEVGRAAASIVQSVLRSKGTIVCLQDPAGEYSLTGEWGQGSRLKELECGDFCGNIVASDLGCVSYDATEFSETFPMVGGAFEGDRVLIAPCVVSEGLQPEQVVGFLLASGLPFPDECPLELLALDVIAGQVGGAVSAARARDAERSAARREAEALTKALSGLVPICAGCKGIRDDEGTWSPLETYLSRQTAAVVSHGLCPSCATDLYPEFVSKIR